MKRTTASKIIALLLALLLGLSACGDPHKGMTGRENDYTWIGPYVDNSIVIVVKSDSGITSLSDLAGKNVITQTSSSAYTALTDNPSDGSNAANLKLAASFKTLDQTADYNTAFMDALDADPALKSKFGKITRLTGDTAACFAALDSGEGDMIVTDSTAVEYENTH